MSLSEEQKQVAIQLLVEKSYRNLQQAIVNAEFGYGDLVANRLYYSIFHVVTALLMKDGIKVETHKGTSSQFGRLLDPSRREHTGDDRNRNVGFFILPV